MELPALRSDGTEIVIEISVARTRLGAEFRQTTFINDVTEQRANIVLQTKLAEKEYQARTLQEAKETQEQKVP